MYDDQDTNMLHVWKLKVGKLKVERFESKHVDGG